MEPLPDLSSYLETRKTPGTVAFALLGSHARGDAGPHSDVDILRFVDDNHREEEARTSLIGTVGAAVRAGGSSAAAGQPQARKWLVVHSTITPSQVESWFSDPGQVVNIMAGLRDGRALWDPDGVFAGIQKRARQFRWTQAHQEKADRLASKELVGWIEEAHKGLEGLLRNDTGRLLNARFGLSWGLAWVMRLHFGVLSASDNTFYDDVIGAVGPESNWSLLLQRSFGASSSGCSPSLREEVQAGLLLYCETFTLLEKALDQDEHILVEATVARIRNSLDEEIVSD